MKTTNVKQSKKNSGWFLAIPHEDEKGFEALSYLRKKGYFNTPLYRLNKNSSQKQITRYYLRYPQRDEPRKYWVGLSEEELAKSVDRKVRHQMECMQSISDRHYRNLVQTQQENEQLKQNLLRMEYENDQLRMECMTEEGLHDYADVVDILESGKYGAWIKVENNDEHPSPKNPNLNFVTPDMSATLGRGTHVMIDIDKVPKDLQVLLAKMMDTLNDHTLRISRLENC